MSLLLLLRSSAGAPPPTSTDGPILEVQLTPGVWTDITRDVIATDSIRWRRGITGAGPMDRVAGTGLVEFTLRNDAQNSGGTRGWYSPNHASVRAGWTYGIACRLTYRFSSTIYPLWRGRVRTILPTAGLYRDRRVYVTGHDAMGDLADLIVRDVPTLINQSETVVLQTVHDAMPAAVQPPGIVLDTAVDTYPYALDDVGDGTNGLGLVADAVTSALGKFFVNHDGEWVYVNRHSLAMLASVLTLTDATLFGGEGAEFSVPSSLATVYDQVRGTVHPKTLGDTDTVVLYASPTVLSIDAGHTLEVFGTYTDPDNLLQTVGATDIQPFTPYVDYEGNVAEDGSGIDATTSLTPTVTAFASTVKFSLFNNGSGTIYLVSGTGTTQGEPRLQLRGRPIYDTAPVTVESPSSATYGNRLLEIDLPYQDDPNIAQDYVNYIHSQYLSLANQVEALSLNPQANSNAQKAAMLSLEIGQAITVSETMTGVSAVPLAIQAIEGEIRAGGVGGSGFVVMTLRTVPTVSTTAFLLDSATLGLLDSGRLGWA